MESSSVILDTRISFFIGKSHPEREVSVREVLRTIGDETYARRINELRSLLEIGDNDKYKEQKKFLPAVTFSGIFKEKRAVETCKCYTHLMVFDIDHCPSNKMNVMAETLRNDMHVIAFWISPSGEGYKGLIRLEYGEEWTYTDDSEKHKCAFRQFAQYMLERNDIEIDKSGSDIPRLCFVSYDPAICIKDEYAPFVPNKKIEEDKEVKALLQAVPKRLFKKSPMTIAQYTKWNNFCGSAKHYRHHALYRMRTANIYKHLRQQGKSITDNYRNWVIVAYTIASWVHPYMGKELFLQLCRLDGKAHSEKNSVRLIEHAYRTLERKISYRYITNLAYQKRIW